MNQKEKELIFAKYLIEYFNNTAKSSIQSAVAIASSSKICRICMKPPKMPLILDFGEEYACKSCLENEAGKNKE